MSAEMLGLLFHYNHYVLKIDTEGLSHEETLRQPAPGGNCLNWVLGHVLANRNTVLRALGEEPIWSAETAEPYERGSAPLTDGSKAVLLERMLADLDASQERIQGALKDMSPERLAQAPPAGTTKDEDDTVETLLTVLAFHEAYHAGQTGLLRRLVGKPGAIP
jgi:uncharacterized damage-inducible protein DinB